MPEPSDDFDDTLDPVDADHDGWVAALERRLVAHELPFADFALDHSYGPRWFATQEASGVRVITMSDHAAEQAAEIDTEGDQL